MGCISFGESSRVWGLTRQRQRPPRPIPPPTNTAVFCVDCFSSMLIWGTDAKDKADPVRVETAFPPSSPRPSSAE